MLFVQVLSEDFYGRYRHSIVTFLWRTMVQIRKSQSMLPLKLSELEAIPHKFGYSIVTRIILVKNVRSLVYPYFGKTNLTLAVINAFYALFQEH